MSLLLSSPSVWRWFALVGGLSILGCGGLSYNFALYSQALKQALGYTQQQVQQLAAAKDIGDNVGLAAGALSALLPTWAMLMIGAAQNSVGYGFLYLIASKNIAQPAFWKVFFCMWLGVNGATYFNTAALVTCVRSFPKSRGVVVGLLKGLIGLSGAIYAQLYTAILAPNQIAFLEAVAIGPSLVAFLVMGILRPSPGKAVHDRRDEEEETKNLRFLVGVCLTLAAYLMADILVSSFFLVTRNQSQLVAVGMMTIIALTCVVPIRVYFSRLLDPSRGGRREGDSCRPLLDEEEGVLGGGGVPRSESPGDSVRPGELEWEEEVKENNGSFLVKGDDGSEREKEEGQQEKEPIVVGGKGEWERREREKEKQAQEEGENQFVIRDFSQSSSTEDGTSTSTELDTTEGGGSPRNSVDPLPPVDEAYAFMKKAKPRRGEDFTLSEGLVKADFWLLFLSIVCGAGSGLTAINNLAQMGQAQGVDDMKVPVALVSIWNYLGRVIGGFYSEHVVRHHGLPRPVILAGAQVVMAVGHLLFAFAVPGSLYIGSLIVGSCYGTTMAMIPAIASEIFGLKNFGLFYNVFTTAVPVGSYLFSGLLAGYIYDREAEKDVLNFSGGALLLSQTNSTVGRIGFQQNIWSKGVVSGNIPQSDSFNESYLANISHWWSGNSDVEGYFSGSSPSLPLVCHGAHCFRLTFIVMAAVCMVGTLANIVLISRTRSVYRRLYGSSPNV